MNNNIPDVKTSCAELPVLFEVDPSSGEATGTVMPFCSTVCREACGGTQYPGFKKSTEGTSTLDSFGYDPKCEECNGDIKTILNERGSVASS